MPHPQPAPPNSTSSTAGSSHSRPPTRLITAAEILAVSAGGAIGATSRYALTRLDFPLATFGPIPFDLTLLGINILGSALLGFLITILSGKPAENPWRLFLGTGVLGGFTTFSALIALTIGVAPGRQIWAWGHLTFHLFACLSAVVLGAAIARWFRTHTAKEKS